MTAYRERSLRAAALLEREGPLSPRELKARLHDPGVGHLLRNNVYGWFTRVEHGVYDISELGRKALVDWAGLLPKIAPPAVTVSENGRPESPG